MNIPRREDSGVLGFEGVPFDVSDLVPHAITDLMVASAYVLLVSSIVFLNRRKYISIYVPRNTYVVVFGVVFLLTFAASIAAYNLPATTLLLAYKVFVAFILFGIAVGIIRLMPRDIDPVEQQRLQLDNAELSVARRANSQLSAELHQARAEVERLVAARTHELSQRTMSLEVDAVQRQLQHERTAEAKRRLDELILRTNTAHVFLDTDGNVLDCNLALSQLVGRGNDETLSGRSLLRLFGLNRSEELSHFLAEAVRQGSFSIEMEVQPPTRGTATFELSGAAAVYESRPCVMALIRDVSDRRAAERKLLENREALSTALEVTRKANATRSDFLAKMNHELRTPLNGIIGLSEIIRFKAQGGSISSVEARKLAGNIHQSGRHLLSVVDDLLDLSRLDSGTREFTPINVVIRAEIDAALVTLGSIADKKRISVRNRCPSEFEWVVDQRAFKQIVINLVNNAIKFSPPGSNVDISVSETENAMSLRIRDEGPGVTPADREKILSPFGRGEFAETHKIDGVGLGLTIVSELLKLQGGYIEIDSQPRIGSTFVAVFPKVAETTDRNATV